MKKSSETEMKFFKILTHTFKYEESQNNLNYNVIQNLMRYSAKIKHKYMKKYIKKE